MKKQLTLFFTLVYFSSYFAQVIIGTGKAVPTNKSVSLEFGNEEKGLILPWVTSETDVVNAAVNLSPPQTTANGTLIFDSADKKTKLMKDGSWFDLTLLNNGAVNTSLQNDYNDKTNAKVSIGSPTSTTGILVLEDNNKGMILPQANSYANISSPEAGMVVFDKSKKMLCVYNGKQWTFWQPNN